jgi:hypothetical protein
VRSQFTGFTSSLLVLYKDKRTHADAEAVEVQLQLEEMQQDLLLDARTKDEQVCVAQHSVYSLY